MIEFRHVTFAYDSAHPVLEDISFQIEEGESVGLIGANGAGKSTVMKLILGLLFPQSGEVLVNGIPVSKDTLADVRRTCGFVLQNSDNQMFMPTVKEDLLFGPVNYGLSREEAEAKADAVLEQLQIEDLKERYNHRLSGGEKRMAAIAAVLAMEPKAVLMDEPTSALDPYNRRQIIGVIKEMPVTRVITSHDLDMILDTCSRVLLIGNGKIQADGSADDILRNKELLESSRLELPLCLQR
ncbi:MAG: ABC transporter ATP-binding protein [Solobacterium sp.]|nr:ABC transporter ATP-binding protein [Solobacterium sp.]